MCWWCLPYTQPIAPQITKRGSTLAGAAGGHDTESSAGSSGSEWETDTDASEAEDALMKPVFVPKQARETLKRQEEVAAEDERRRALEAERLEERKLETRRLVAEEIRREQEAGDTGGTTDVEMPDDTDGVDPDQEYRDWELREMRRIKRCVARVGVGLLSRVVGGWRRLLRRGVATETGTGKSRSDRKLTRSFADGT